MYNVLEKPIAQVKPKIVRQFPAQQTETYNMSEWSATTVSTPSLNNSPGSRLRRAESMKISALRSQSTPEVAQETSGVEAPRLRRSLPIKPSPLLLSSNSPSANDKHSVKEEFKFNSLPRGFKLQHSKAFVEGMGTQVMHASASHLSAKNLLLERAIKLLKETEVLELKEKLEKVSFLSCYTNL